MDYAGGSDKSVNISDRRRRRTVSVHLRGSDENDIRALSIFDAAASSRCCAELLSPLRQFRTFAVIIDSEQGERETGAGRSEKH